MDTMFEDLAVPKFDGENYAWWSIIMKTLLKAKGFWEIIQEGYEEPLKWSSLEGEEKRVKKEKQYQNCLALMDIRKGMNENVFPLIASCKSASIAWKVLKDVFDVNEYEACVNKGEPSSFGEGSWEEPCFKDPFEGLFEDMSYEEGMHDDEFFLEEEDEEEPYEEGCETLEESNVEPLMGMEYCNNIHIAHKEDDYFYKEAYEECPLKTPSQPYDDECFMEEAYCEPILMMENEEEPTTHYWQDCFFDKAQDDDTLKEECSMAENYSHGVENIDEKAEIIWDVDPYDIDDEEEMRAISSMLIKEKEENEDDYLKEEIEDNEIAIDGLHGEMEASRDLESCIIEATICKEEPWEFLIMNEEMIALKVKERLMWISTHQNIIRGDDFLFFGLFANATNECLLIRCVKDSLKAMENGGECLIKALFEDCIMETTLKSLPWEKTLMKNLGHVDPNDDCKTLVKYDFLSDTLCEEQHIVAYEISQCVAFYYLKVCVEVCERVLWYNYYCEIMNTYSCGVWICNDVKAWFEDHPRDEREWLIKITYGETFVEGGATQQKEALNEGATSTKMKKIPHNKWKECLHHIFQNFDFLLIDWRKHKLFSSNFLMFKEHLGKFTQHQGGECWKFEHCNFTQVFSSIPSRPIGQS